ncbi:MAG: hypothetical protein KDB53_11260, partial [Planctomycetes bacterium]|nr:hypothetical protein [Planctomycetota bacterium]
LRPLPGWPDGPLVLKPLGISPIAGDFVSVCASSTSDAEAQHARSVAADGLVEDMETWSVALACHLENIPLHALRAVSNRAGDRDHRRWRMDAAIEALRETLPVVIERLHRP